MVALLTLKHSERVFNTLVGLNLFLWAGLGIHLDWTGGHLPPVRFSVAALNVTAGILFIIRMPLKKQTSIHHGLVVLVTFIGAGAAFKLSPSLHIWPRTAETLFIAGTLIAIVSLCFLGRSFSVMPALRGIVTHGPYSIIRHPAYAGELLMVAACFIARPSWIASAALTLCLLGLLYRILLEERLLSGESAYTEYQSRVKYRLLPGLW